MQCYQSREFKMLCGNVIKVDIKHIDLVNNTIISNKRPPSSDGLNDDSSAQKSKTDDSCNACKNEGSIRNPFASQGDHMEQLAKM